MSKKTSKRIVKKNVVTMPVVNHMAAGIDVGDTIHVAALPEGISDERVRTFGSMTCDLLELIAWLKKYKIISVAMESTGVYWRVLFSLLVKEGFEVHLVNSRHVKNVTGRKNDEDDAMWLQKLHSCGLLRSSYLPEEEQESLRSIVRYRKMLVQDSSRFVLRMQKSFELMNIKLHTVISDITGKTGIAIIEAILAGERNAVNFLPLVDRRIKANEGTIVKSLEGNWRDDHIFTLRESYEFYKFYLQGIDECDKQIEQQLRCYEAYINDGVIDDAGHREVPNETKPKPKRKNKNQPKFDVRQYLRKIHGVDVMAIYGINEIGGLDLLAETGTDLSKWETEKHFVSWLNLCPNNKISGGKLISSQLMNKKANRASQAFRSAANSLQKSDNWLGHYFRRMKSRHGNKYAITATANKLATIYYKMVRFKKEFIPVDLNDYQLKNKEKQILHLERKIKKLKETLQKEVA